CEAAYQDCNSNGRMDVCDVFLFGLDCNTNGVPDGCELATTDCNSNGIPDACDGAADCNHNGIPDSCEVVLDCNTNGTDDWCEAVDCNTNGVPDSCEVVPDCNTNGTDDWCEAPDDDRDGVIVGCDNCNSIFNPDQQPWLLRQFGASVSPNVAPSTAITVDGHLATAFLQSAQNPGLKLWYDRNSDLSADASEITALANFS